MAHQHFEDVAIQHGSHIGILKNDGLFTCLESADPNCPMGNVDAADLCFRHHEDPLVACCDDSRIHLHVHRKSDCDVVVRSKKKSFKLLESDEPCDIFPLDDSFHTGCAQFPNPLTRHEQSRIGCIGDGLKPLKKIWHGDHFDHLVPGALGGVLEFHQIHKDEEDGTENCCYHGQIYLRNDENICELQHAEDTQQENTRVGHGKKASCTQQWPHSFALFSLYPTPSSPVSRRVDELLGRVSQKHSDLAAQEGSKVDELLGRVSPKPSDLAAQERSKQRTVMIVEGICCPSEEPIIRKILEPMTGVHSVQINIMAKKVIVEHDNFQTPQVNLVSALNAAHLGARIFHESDGAKLASRYPPWWVTVSGVAWLVSLLSWLTDVESIPSPHKENFEHLKWVGILACAIGFPPIARKAFGSLRMKVLDVNCLMSIAIVGALILQEFVEAGAVVFLFSLGEWLETRATERTRLALSAITSMRPEEAETLKGERIPVEDVNVGDILAIRVGTKAPVDGIVVRGEGQFDESQITGESLPVVKEVGDSVHAGTISVSGYVEFEATCVAADSSVAKLTRMVEEAASSRSPTEKLVETFSKYYTPIVVVFAFLLATIPWTMTSASDRKANNEDTIISYERAQNFTKQALILLVVACPCALVISTPVTYISALVTCTHNSILVKGGMFLEVFGAVKFVLLDKTGTLTESRFEVQEFKQFSSEYTPNAVLRFLRAVENYANHPLASCIVRYAEARIGDEEDVEVDDFEVVPGVGVQGKVEGKLITVGNARLAERMKWPLDVHGTSGTLVWVGIDDELVASVVLDDTIRDGVAAAIEKLHKLNIRTVMLTGDNDKQAQAVGKKVGIQEIESELLPEDKITHVHSRKLLASRGKVAMIGDGINDAAALAAADVGVAMGAAGTALAVETADVTLLDSNVARLPFLIELGRSTVRTIRFNIIFSVAAKLALFVLVFMDIASLWHAIVADVGTMILVTLNGMRLLRVKGVRVVYNCHDDDKQKKRKHRHRQPGCCGGGHSYGKSDGGDCCNEDKSSCADKKCCTKEEVKSSCADKKCCAKEEVKSSCADKKCCAKEEVKPSCADKKCCTKEKEEAKPSCADKKCCTKEKEVKATCADKKCCTKEKDEAKPSSADKKCCSKKEEEEEEEEEAKPTCVDEKCCTKEKEEAKPSCADKKCCTKEKEEAKLIIADKKCCAKEKEEAKSSCADKKCCVKEKKEDGEALSVIDL